MLNRKKKVLNKIKKYKNKQIILKIRKRKIAKKRKS